MFDCFIGISLAERQVFNGERYSSWWQRTCPEFRIRAVSRAGSCGGRYVVWPVTDQAYGGRVGRIVDPFGHHWEIGKPLA
jgi:uncharacterized glyoxalase superfamily protein PhnB